MLYVISTNCLSREEFALAVSLQGCVNKNQLSLFLDVDNYLCYVEEKWQYITLPDALEKFCGLFKGQVIFDVAADDPSVNMAATICAAEELLGVPRSLSHTVNLPVISDLAEIKGTPAQRQRVIFNACKDKLNKTALVHQTVAGGDFHLQLRDLGIAERIFTFSTTESAEDMEFRREVLAWANPNVPVYGWTTDEISFVKSVSEYGDYVIPMDWSCNHSYFAKINKAIKIEQKPLSSPPPKGNKHYVAIVVSDGDNVQWLERDFAFESTYGQRLASGKNYKMNWTVAPSMAHMCPQVLSRLYRLAGNDCFITGVSGVGYANLLTFPFSHLSPYASATAAAMEEADLEYMGLLDNVAGTADIEEVKRRLDCFARYPQIKGGIWQLDPDRYQSGSGRIFTSTDGKPFVSVRFSLWHPSNRMGSVTKQWLQGYANAINAMPVAPDREEGYTVLNVHPWTVKISDLDYLVSLLDEHVELVFVPELIDQINKNIIAPSARMDG